MANWIRLTTHDDAPIYLNLDEAACIKLEPEGGSLIGFRQAEQFANVYVQEAPDQIFSSIEG